MQCGYFPEKECLLEAKLIKNIDPETMDFLLAQGWRHFGHYFFKPACHNCRDCIPIRIPVEKFKMRKDQKRNWKKNANIQFLVLNPSYTQKKFTLYQEHCRFRFQSKQQTKSLYYLDFIYSPPTTYETNYFLNNELIGTGYIDITESSISSIYFFYARKVLSAGPGVFSILKEIQFAKRLKKKYLYLGYYIKDNHFMAYKNRFLPNQKYNWETGIWS